MSIVEIDYEKLIQYVKNKMNDKTPKNGYINNYINIFPLIKKWLNKNGYNVGVNEVADVIYNLGELKKEIEMSREINGLINPIDIENSMRMVQKCDRMIMISTPKHEKISTPKHEKAYLMFIKTITE